MLNCLKLKLPVILRPTTKVCHSSGTVETGGSIYEYEPEGFVKDPAMIFRPSYRLLSRKQQNEISELFDSLPSTGSRERGSTASLQAGSPMPS